MAEMMRKVMRKAVLLCLCLVLLAGSAMANEIVDISLEGYDYSTYNCTLPDGRVIISGCSGKPGNYMESKARILCLNPDGTVSWEYVDPANGSWSCYGVVLLKDGTLCARLSNDPYQQTVEEKLVFFTRDGRPTGREIQLDVVETRDSFVGHGITSSCWYTYCFSDDKSKEYTEYTDWDGSVLFRTTGCPIRVDDILDEEDGLVLVGDEGGAYAAAKIMKFDWQGNTLWETVVPFIREANKGAVVREAIKTSDGCYLAMLLERPVDIYRKWKIALVKFSPTGRILWKNEETFDRLPECSWFDLIEYDGKYVLEFEYGGRYDSLDEPIRFLWFDTDGKELGISELSVRKEELPRLAKEKKAELSFGFMFVMGDELWGTFDCSNASANHEKNMASVDTVLIRIPEL